MRIIGATWKNYLPHAPYSSRLNRVGSRVGTVPVLDDLRHHYKLTFEVASVNPGSPLLENKSRGSRTPPATRYTVQPLLRV